MIIWEILSYLQNVLYKQVPLEEEFHFIELS